MTITIPPPKRGPRLAEQAADLYLLGFSQTTIAGRLGITQPRVSQLLAQVRQSWDDASRASQTELIAQERARIERLLRATESGLARGDPRMVEAATKLSERLSRLLGLDYSDRLSARRVAVEEAQQQMLAAAIVAVLDFLGVTGDTRQEALRVLETSLVIQS